MNTAKIAIAWNTRFFEEGYEQITKVKLVDNSFDIAIAKYFLELSDLIIKLCRTLYV